MTTPSLALAAPVLAVTLLGGAVLPRTARADRFKATAVQVQGRPGSVTGVVRGPTKLKVKVQVWDTRENGRVVKQRRGFATTLSLLDFKTLKCKSEPHYVTGKPMQCALVCVARGHETRTTVNPETGARTQTVVSEAAMFTIAEPAYRYQIAGTTFRLITTHPPRTVMGIRKTPVKRCDAQALPAQTLTSMAIEGPATREPIR